MIRRLSIASLLLATACGSSSATSGGTPTCPDLSGMWTITAHCDPSLVGQTVMVTQTACDLAFAAPFNGFTGTVTADDMLTVSGPQSCTGTGTATAISMSCTPGTCAVTLSR